MRLRRGWCLCAKSPTPALRYRSLPKIRKNVRVRTVASAATYPPMPEITSGVDDRTLFARSCTWLCILPSWSLTFWYKEPNPFCWKRPLMYSCGPPGAFYHSVTPMEPVDQRVEHRRQKERGDEPADECA